MNNSAAFLLGHPKSIEEYREEAYELADMKAMDDIEGGDCSYLDEKSKDDLIDMILTIRGVPEKLADESAESQLIEIMETIDAAQKAWCEKQAMAAADDIVEELYEEQWRRQR